MILKLIYNYKSFLILIIFLFKLLFQVIIIKLTLIKLHLYSKNTLNILYIIYNYLLYNLII